MLLIRRFALTILISTLAFACKNTPKPSPNGKPQGFSQSQLRLEQITNQIEIFFDRYEEGGKIVKDSLGRAYAANGALMALTEDLNVLGTDSSDIDPPAVLVATQEAITYASYQVSLAVSGDASYTGPVRDDQLKSLLQRAQNELTTLRRAALELYSWKVRNASANLAVDGEFKMDVVGPARSTVAAISFEQGSAGPIDVEVECPKAGCEFEFVLLHENSTSGAVGLIDLRKGERKLSIMASKRTGYVLSPGASAFAGFEHDTAPHRIKLKQKLWVPSSFRLSDAKVKKAGELHTAAHEAAHVVQQRLNAIVSNPSNPKELKSLAQLLNEQLVDALNDLSKFNQLKAGDPVPLNEAAMVEAFNKLHRLTRGRAAELLDATTVDDGESVEELLRKFHDTAKAIISNIRA